MRQAKDLATAMKNMLTTGDEVQLGKVVTVDKENATCDIEVNELEVGDVRIQAVIKSNGKGIKTFPAPGSWVLVQKLGEKGNWFISMFSEVEDVLIEIDNTVFEIKDGFLLKKNDETLKKLFDDLIDQVKSIVVPTNVGPSGTPINAPAFDAIKNRAGTLLK